MPNDCENQQSDTIYEQLSKDDDRSIIQQVRESKMWGEIRSTNNPAMIEYRNRCIELYHLLKNEHGRLPR